MSHPGYWSWPRITLAISVRVVLVTFLITLLAFALGLLLGIVTLAVVSAFNGQADLASAYRNFALPAAFVGLFAGLTGMLVIEIRQLRRIRTRYDR